MATKQEYPTIEWKPGELTKVIACIGDAQNALAHFQRLFETRSGNKDFFSGLELMMLAALVRTWAEWQDKSDIDLNAVADKLDDGESGGDGAGGKNVPDSPR